MPEVRSQGSIVLSDDSSSNYFRASASSIGSNAVSSSSQHSAGMNSVIRDRKTHSKKIIGQPGGVHHIATGMNAILPEDPTPRRIRTIGGDDHVVLGEENLSYNFGVKEAQYRLATDPEMKAATAREPMAGLRPPEHTHRPSGPIGGTVHVRLEDGSGTGPQSYNEGMDEAQRRGAFDPQALAERDALVPAGSRVLRPVSIHVSRPTGGVDSVNIIWPEPSQSNDTASKASTLRNLRQQQNDHNNVSSSHGENTGSPSRILHPIHPVGGRSGAYLGGTSLSGIFTQDTNSTTNRPSTASGRHNQSNTSNSISNIFGTNTSGSGNNIANTPRSPLRREQPLGGRSTLSIGIHGLDVPTATKVNVLGVQTLPHQRSGVVFG